MFLTDRIQNMSLNQIEKREQGGLVGARRYHRLEEPVPFLRLIVLA